MTILAPDFTPSPTSDDVALVSAQIAANFGFTPPEAYVADLIRFVDGGHVRHWHGDHSVLFWTTLMRSYGFESPHPYIEALKAFVDDLLQMRTGEADDDTH